MKKVGILLMFLALSLLSGCDGNKIIREKVVRIPEFSGMVVADGEIVPNQDFGWKMSPDEFLSDVYGSALLNPESLLFDEQRYSYSEEFGVTSMKPPVLYRLEGAGVDAEVQYSFKADGLYSVSYTWHFKSNAKDAQACAALLAEDLNANPDLIPAAFEEPDFSQLKEEGVSYRWELKETSEQYVEMRLRQLYAFSFVIINVCGS